MKILVFFAALASVCVAEKLPSRSGYSLPQPASPFTHQAARPQASRHPAPQQTFSAPQTSYNAPTRRPQVSQPTFSAPQTSYNAPTRRPQVSQPTFSAPQASYNAPTRRPQVSQPTFSAPQASYNAPTRRPQVSQPTFSAPQASYNAPTRRPQVSQPTFSAPQASYSAPAHRGVAAKPVVPILRDERVHPVGGAYSFNVETGDGIVRQETGTPVYALEGPVSAVTGSYSFTLPDGQLFELRYVADQNGFQPQSAFLPVAPAFPHPIPAHALEQIERAQREREARARGGVRSPSQGYGAPAPPQRPSNAYGVPQ